MKKFFPWIRPVLCAVFLGLTPFLASSEVAAAETQAQEEDYTVPEGVTVEGMDMSGKTPDEVHAVIDEFAENMKQKKLLLVSEQVSLEMTLGEAGLKLSDETVINEACYFAATGNYIKRFKALKDAKEKGVDFKLEFSCDEAVLEAALESRRPETDTQAKDAVLVRKNGEFIITPETVGRTMDLEATKKAVSEAVAGSWRDDEVRAPLLLSLTEPAHTSEELSVIKDELGAYETSFAGSAGGRIANIKNGAAKLENFVLYPGEEYSFLEMMRPFTAANGYHMAGTYVNGRNTPGMGGGICQVSSTLYNAVLRAELTVTERSNHMMTVGYVPLGADATVANPSTDFKFKNETSYPVLIEAYTYGTTLYIRIYGKEERPENRTVEFITVTEQVIAPGADVLTYDKSKPSGYVSVEQNAHTGYVAAFYKNVYIDGKLSEQTLVNRSKYGAYPRYITKGSGG